MTILLGGGGSADDERPILDRFLDLVPDRPIAYWPIALDQDDYTDATAFAENALGRKVVSWTRLDRHHPGQLEDHAGVFIGGGNTYYLLSEVRRCGFANALRAFASHSVLYGGSAGAIICGADIGSSAYFDSNDVGLTDTTGLDLLGGYSVWCHFASTHLDDIRQWTRSSGRPAIVLSERAGVEVSGANLISLGREPLVIASPQGDLTELVPGQSISCTWELPGQARKV